MHALEDDDPDAPKEKEVPKEKETQKEKEKTVEEKGKVGTTDERLQILAGLLPSEKEKIDPPVKDQIDPLLLATLPDNEKSPEKSLKRPWEIQTKIRFRH